MIGKISRRHRQVAPPLESPERLAINLAEVVRRLAGNAFLQEKVLTAGEVQMATDEVFKKAKLATGGVVLFPGVIITGAAFSYLGNKIVLREVKTESVREGMSRARRFTHPGAGFAFIGVIDGYDTYIDYNVLPRHVLVFRFGDGHSDYESHIVGQVDAPGFAHHHAEATHRFDVITTFFTPVHVYKGEN